MTAISIPAPRNRLEAYALFGAILSAAGLPIYIYAPKYYADTFGVSLTALGAVLFALRLFDVVQDPVLGWLSERLGPARRVAVAIVGIVMAVSMIGLFAVEPKLPPLAWFALTLAFLFTAFSFLSITFYAQGVAKAETLPGNHVQLAAWRESGALLGVCLAAMAPALLVVVTEQPYAMFAVGFAIVVVFALLAMNPEWTPAATSEAVSARVILKDVLARRLLILALVNAAPLAVTSTLFLFYVDDVLELPGMEGALLVVFFLSAAAAAPLWARLSDRIGPRPALLVAMTISILSFGFVLSLGPGDFWLFLVVCIGSGAAIGADLTLLPALFAKRMSRIAPNGGQGFGLWALVSKFSLAIAAATLLPLLEAAGFTTTGQNNPAALQRLIFFYAVIPCVLKLVAVLLLLATPVKEI